MKYFDWVKKNKALCGLLVLAFVSGFVEAAILL